MTGFIMFIFFLKINTMAQLSFPDYRTNPVWRVKDISNPNPTNMGVYRLGTETIMAGKIFLKLYYKNQTWTKDSLVGFITDGETGHSKYYIKRVATPEYPNPKLHLLYDFSLQEGDSTYCAPSSLYADSDSFKFWVVKIDYVTYEGITHKRLKMNYMASNGADWGEMYWVEGIGSLYDPFYLFDCYTGGCEGQLFLGCFENEGILQYINRNVSLCNSVGVSEKEFDDSAIKLFPTIASNEIQIENNTDRQLKVVILNSVGQSIGMEIFRDKQKTIDIYTFPTGIYFANFWDNRLLKSIKFVKN